eukprot:gene7494-8325_t
MLKRPPVSIVQELINNTCIRTLGFSTFLEMPRNVMQMMAKIMNVYHVFAKSWLLFGFCDRVQNEKALRKKLGILSANNAFRIPPAQAPINVNISLTLLQILKVDEKNGIFSSSVWLRLSWKDNSMKWNSSEYGNVTEMRVSPDRVWVPDIFLLNNAEGSFEVQGALAKLIIRSNGVIIWSNPALYKSSCSLDMTNFPFDDQKCLLNFGSLTYNTSSSDIFPEKNEVETFRYVKSGEWVLMGTSAKRLLRHHDRLLKHQDNDQPSSYVTYTITIRRRTLYYIMNFILPCVLIAVLTILVFLLPPESGERVSYGITVILSFTMLLLMLYEKLPVTSDSYPLIAEYYACTTFQVSIALAICCWVLRFYHHDPPMDEIPRWVKVFVLNWLARIVRLKKSTDQVRQELILHSWEGSK